MKLPLKYLIRIFLFFLHIQINDWLEYVRFILLKSLLSHSYSNNGSFEIPYGGWVFDVKYSTFQSLWNKIPIHINESIVYWSSFINDIPEKQKKEGKAFQTGLINLNGSENELLGNTIHAKRRNMIRKAEKSGITIENMAMRDCQNILILCMTCIKRLV